MTRTAFDVANPERLIGGFDICCFYLGGMAEHVWTAQQISRQRQRYRLPIWVYDPTRDPLEQAKEAVANLVQLKAPRGITVAFDLETRIAAAAVNGFADYVHASGGFTMPYGSTSSLFYNPVRSGYWVADPTETPHQYEHPHVRGTQYSWKAVADTGQRIDLSLFDDTLPLWDLQGAPSPPPIDARGEALKALNVAAVQIGQAEYHIQQSWH